MEGHPRGAYAPWRDGATAARRPAGKTWLRRLGIGVVAVLTVGGLTVLPPGRATLADTTLGSPIPLGSKPAGIGINPTTNRIYVANNDANTVKVIDGTTNSVVGSPISVGMGPAGVGVNPATNRVYVANFDSNTVTVIDGATNSVVGSPIPIPPKANDVTAHPLGVGVNPTNNRIYVTGFFSDAVTVIDGATNTVVGAPILVCQSPVSAGVNPVTNRIYVACQSSSDVTVIDGVTNTVVGSPIKVGSAAQAIAVNPVTDRIYVTSFGDGTVTTIDGATNTVVGMPVQVSAHLGLGIGVNPGTNLVHVSAFGDNKVWVIDSVTNAVVGGPIPVGANPLYLGVNSVTNQTYVGNVDDHSVTAIGIPLAITVPATPSGNTVTATWSSLVVPNDADFVGLFERGAPNTSPLSRRFTNGTVSAGGAGVAAGSVDLPIPAGLVAGSYDVRLVSGAAGGTLAVVSTTRITAADDRYTTHADGTLTVPAPGVLANDTPATSPPLQATIVTNPAHGTLSLQPNGAFTYTPSTFFSGADSFTYRADSQLGLPSTATVTLTITAPPVGANDSYTVAQGSVLTVPAPGVLANDTDPDSPSLQAGLATNPAHGRLTLQSDGSFTYTPTPGFAGADSFTYRVSDQTSISQPVAVTISVTVTDCTPRPPTRVTQAASAGKLVVHVQSGTLNTQQPNPLRSLRFGTLQNANVAVNGQPVASGQTVDAPAGSSALDFTVERATPGQATTVPFTVTDGCGEWPTFVGGGPGAGF